MIALNGDRTLPVGKVLNQAFVSLRVLCGETIIGETLRTGSPSWLRLAHLGGAPAPHL